MKKSYTFLLALATLAACQQQPQQSPTPETAQTGLNKFADPILRELYTLQDERNTTGLLQYMNHPSAQYRKEAALAFASVQDTLAIPQLLASLSDTTANIRIASAYALGQIGQKKAQQAMIRIIQQESHPRVQAELLESLGKVTDASGLQFLATYKAPNETAQTGQAWGLYRAGLRQVSSAQTVEQAVQWLVQAAPYEVRLAAANQLARTPKLDLSPYRQQLTTVVTSDTSADVRMAVAQAFAKVNASDKAALLSGIAQSDPDYRVRLSAIRSMAGLDFEAISEAIVAGLTDENINTAVATAEFLQTNHAGAHTPTLRKALERVNDGRVRAGIIWVILRNSPEKGKLSQEYRQLYLRTENPYEKAHLLKALAADYGNHDFIAQEAFAAKHPVVGTYGMEALAAMRQQPDFPNAMEQAFAGYFKQGVASGDVSLAGLAAGIIRNPKLNYRDMFRDYTFLVDAQKQLVLPRDMETNIELQKTIDYLSGKEQSETPKNPFTHPIDWELVQRIHSNQEVIIETAKGPITLELFVEDAPGSVANFVELTEKKFFNGLYFHRVVPNFVAQGGDKRGDGWGSSDYSIRSEFARLHYREGYVGMASAGKDTESNQWFITHSPTPHLDGRYTIFAKVKEGMDVVHQLEVGDKIDRVYLLLRARTK